MYSNPEMSLQGDFYFFIPIFVIYLFVCVFACLFKWILKLSQINLLTMWLTDLIRDLSQLFLFFLFFEYVTCLKCKNDVEKKQHPWIHSRFLYLGFYFFL